MKTETIQILVTVEIGYDETKDSTREEAIRKALKNSVSCNFFGFYSSSKAIKARLLEETI